MTNVQILMIVVAVLVTPLSNSLFRKYVDPKLPEPKILFLYVKKLFSIIGFLLPLVVVIVEMSQTKIVDKNFVLTIAIGVASFLFNALSYFMLLQLSLLKEVTGHHRELSQSFITKMNEINDVNASTTEVFKLMKEFIENQTEINSRHQKRIEGLGIQPQKK